MAAVERAPHLSGSYVGGLCPQPRVAVNFEEKVLPRNVFLLSSSALKPVILM